MAPRPKPLCSPIQGKLGAIHEIELSPGDVFWSCQNAIKTLYGYEVIDDNSRDVLQKLVIKRYGDVCPAMYPTRKLKRVKPGNQNAAE